MGRLDESATVLTMCFRILATASAHYLQSRIALVAASLSRSFSELNTPFKPESIPC